MEFEEVLRSDKKEQVSRQCKVFLNEGPLVAGKEIASSYRFCRKNASSDFSELSDLVNEKKIKKITRNFFGRHFRS